jgi:molybdenum cofactor synthesis domain-containing protein
MGEISVLLIGDELLAAAIEDENLTYIIRSFGACGYETREVRIVGDSIPAIGAAARELARTSDYLVSSGGVGPTHDDVTHEGIALGMEAPLMRDAIMYDFLVEKYGEGFSDRVERMARIPAGSEIILQPGQGWPIVRKDNIFILPGLPRALRDKVDRIVRMIPARGSFFSAEVFLRADEADYADWLEEFQARHEELVVGSYPYWHRPDYDAKIRIRSREKAIVDEALREIDSYVRERGWHVRTEKTREDGGL